jgi:hypothetical protein
VVTASDAKTLPTEVAIVKGWVWPTRPLFPNHLRILHPRRFIIQITSQKVAAVQCFSAVFVLPIDSSEFHHLLLPCFMLQ